ncbi:hypothetical protein Kfla_0765 [Kribbella flavida DSM 17836]|uniref:PE domain-containing protein n=1 Tax=Kribbella flavida (strain DSM 17836 / JCM 10339 / NBRC 14399) TaxID=479435 RepID=D2PYN8_KRIFD|nr:hypothetical protein [Kribbella flavida]ADB29884.1 hypothetical protein Kfla_0765 [Kribbella flavida DSM 17836]
MSPDPAPINLGGVGDIDIYPAETQALLQQIQQAGATFAARWAALGPAIAEDETKVGTGFDDLSTAFRNQYNELAPKLAELSNNVEGSFERMGASGHRIVAEYLELSQHQVDQMRTLE